MATQEYDLQPWLPAPSSKIFVRRKKEQVDKIDFSAGTMRKSTSVTFISQPANAEYITASVIVPSSFSATVGGLADVTSCLSTFDTKFGAAQNPKCYSELFNSVFELDAEPDIAIDYDTMNKTFGRHLDCGADLEGIDSQRKHFDLFKGLIDLGSEEDG